MNPERWITHKNIFGAYILSHATLDEVGKIYGISRERVRQINEEVLEKLSLDKKLSLYKKSEYRPKEWLLVKDSLGSDIVGMLEQGLSPEQIKLQFEQGLSRSQAIKTLKMLRELDFNIERIPSAAGEFLRIQQQLLEPDLSDEKIQQLLNQINTSRGMDVLIKSGSIIYIRELARSAGIHAPKFSGDRLAQNIIKDSKIPVGECTLVVLNGPQKGDHIYRFIAAQHNARAENALKSNPALARFLENPVKQISGLKTKIPNTTQIFKKDGVNNI